MLSRRRFIHSSLLAASAASALSLCAGARAWAGSRALPAQLGACLSSCFDPIGITFASTLPTRVQRIAVDTDDYLQRLIHVLDGSCDAIVGLTRDAEALLVYQLAAERGYERVYMGMHRGERDGIHHEFSGGANLTTLAPRIVQAEHAWSAVLADTIPWLAAQHGQGAHIRARTGAAHSTALPEQWIGHRVSWAYVARG